MDIHDFRSNPLPDSIINALLSATQAYTEVNVLLREYADFMPLLSDILLVLDVYYLNYNSHPEVENIYRALYIPDNTNKFNKEVSSFTNCVAYAKKKVISTEVLTAGDILMINATIKAGYAELVLPDKTIIKNENLIDPVWSILYDLYNPKPQYSLLLETAIACYRFLIFSEAESFSMQTLIILFSTVIKNECIFYGFTRQWVLFTDPRVNLSSLGIIHAIEHILSVFQGMWEYSIKLLRTLINHRNDILYRINEILPNRASTDIVRILSESLYIRRKQISDKLMISPNTITKILKQLEQKKILTAEKYWREVYYFNNLLMEKINDQK